VSDPPPTQKKENCAAGALYSALTGGTMNFKLGLAIFIAASLVAGNAIAQNISADEKAIRDLIAADDSGKPRSLTADSIFWSGAYKRPSVRGQEKPEPMPGLEGRASTKQKTKVRRIEVSKSGDMAYEFSDAEVTVEDKSGQTRSFMASLLRVWKKVDGQWQIAAHFQRPHED
jgi:ketosteroid isomerase-like protein